MKLLNYLVLSIFSVLLFSCENAENTPQPLTQEDIQGEWLLSELNASEAVDLDNDGNSSIDLTTETNCFEGMAVNFEEDTYQFTYPKISFTGETNETLNCTDTLNTGTYTLENNVLTATTTIDDATNTESVNVELTNNQLKFTITRTQVNQYLDLDSSDNENSDLEFLEFIFEK